MTILLYLGAGAVQFGKFGLMLEWGVRLAIYLNGKQSNSRSLHMIDFTTSNVIVIYDLDLSISNTFEIRDVSLE